MKRIWDRLVLCALCAALCGGFVLLSACGKTATEDMPPPSADPADTVPTAIGAETQPAAIAAWEPDALFAAGYLGYFTEDNARPFAEAFAQEQALGAPEVLLCGGPEGYVVAPRYEGSSITVRRWSDAARETAEEVLTTDRAVILFCNPEGLTPNVELTLRYGADEAVFSPALDPETGDLILPEAAAASVQRIAVSPTRTAGDAASAMVGDWRALAKEGEDGLGHYDLTVTAAHDGEITLVMSYADGEEPREIARTAGTWSFDGDTAVFSAVSDGEAAETRYRVEAEAGEWRTLILTRISGEANFPLAEADGQVVFTEQI